jgi:hypothetical protein
MRPGVEEENPSAYGTAGVPAGVKFLKAGMVEPYTLP